MANIVQKGIIGLTALVSALAPATINHAKFYISQASAFEVNPNGYPVPNVEGLPLRGSGYMDNSKEIPGRETFVERFILPSGGIIARLRVGREIYAYAVNDPANGQYYAIVAGRGKGKFIEKYTGNEEFFVPRWLVDSVLNNR